jgi:uncharacterized protein (TIGR02996 family)
MFGNSDSLWNSRIVMILGAVLGVLLFLIAGGLLVFAEHQAISTAAGLEEGAGKVVNATPDKVDPANDGKLVHLSGEATTTAPLADPQLGIAAPALVLSRDVEVRQWKENKTESKKGKDKATVTYDYEQIWSSKKPPSSSTFFKKEGHENPPDKPFADDKFAATDARLGAFALTPAQLKHLSATDPLPVTEEMLAKVPDEFKDRAKVAPDGLLFIGTNPGSTPQAPQVGDVQIRYKVVKPQTVTVLARQTGNTFAPFTAQGSDIDLIKTGQHSPQAMIESAQSSAKMLNWGLRVVSLALLAGAFFLVLRPLASAVSGAPPEGIGFNIRVGVFALGFSLAVALLLIGVRWVFHEPIIGSGLLAGGLVLLLGMFLVARAGKVGLFAGGTKWSEEDRDYFRRIALDPENTDLRLEFADRLEKKGNPLGEFIRLDEELEAIPEGDERRQERDSRWGELLQTHGGTWYQPLRRLRLEPKVIGTFFPALWMHHGIIDEVTVDLAGILPEKAEQLFAAVPGLRVLAFHNIRTEPGLGGWKDTTYEPDVPAIVRVPQLEQICVLKMSSLQLKREDLEAIASSPYLKNLTELDFSYNDVGPEGALAIAQSATLKNLRVLELRSCSLGEKGAAVLAKSPNLARLVTLNLGANAIGPRGTASLAASPHLKNLQTLLLDDNALTASGIQAVAASPHFRALTELDLSGNESGPQGAQVLAASPNLAKITTLKLNNNRLGGAGLRFLAASPHLGAVNVLELTLNEIDDAGAQALATCAVIRKLKELSLSYNNIGDVGFKALAAWPGLAGVQKLGLRENKAGPAGAIALASSPHLVGLKELDLSKNEISITGARALAESRTLRTLTTLWIQEANLTSEGEKVLRKRFGDNVHLS